MNNDEDQQCFFCTYVYFHFFQLNVLQNQAEELLKMLMKTVKNQRETINILLLKHKKFRLRRLIIIQIIDFGVHKKLDVLQQVKQKTLPEGDSLELTQFHTF